MYNKHKRRYKNKTDYTSVIPGICLMIAFYIFIKTSNIKLASYFFIATNLAVIIAIGINKAMKQKKIKKSYLESGIGIVDTLSGEAFEEFVLVHFEKLGYKGKITSKTNDYGADIILEKDNIKTVVQAKRWREKVGIKAIQEVIGAIKYYNADRSMVITNSYFTPNATALAESNNVELWDRSKLIEIMSKAQGRELASDISWNSPKGDKEYCPNCNSEMIYRNGKRGEFLGCTNYPNCKYTKAIY